MTNNVFGMHGAPIITPGTVLPEIVECLEDLLMRAKAGEIQCFCYAYVYGDGATGAGRRGLPSYSLIGRLEEVKINILQALE